MPDPSSSRLLLRSYALTGLAGLVVGVVLVLIVRDRRFETLAHRLASALGWSQTTGMALLTVLLLVLLLFGLLVTIVWIGFRGTSELRARLSMLADASALFAAGRLQYRIDMPGDDDLALTANRLNAMAQTLQEQVRALQEASEDNLELRKDAVVAATIRERERVQRELHDRVSQHLFGLTMLCKAADRQRLKRPDAALALLPELTELAQQTQGAMRSLLLELRPQQLGERNLAGALQALAEELASRTGIAITCQVRDDRLHPEQEPLNQSSEDALFLIGQEALLNALKHAEARTIAVELYIERERVVLRVCDDGVGFATVSDELIASPLTSVGLNSMRERAQLIGGSCVMQNREEGGAQVLAIIPRV